MIDKLAIQRKLKKEKLYKGEIDGLWGPLTQSAYSAYVRKQGGIVPPWLAIAEGEMGVAELYGSRHNPRIVEYHQATTLKAKADEVAWCSAFVNWCLQQLGIKGTKSAAARSWLNYGTPLAQPTYGCIAVFKRGSSAWQGHVAFYLVEDTEQVLVLGGNQSDKVCVTAMPRSSLLAYRACLI